jgi:hypothetical protein
VAVDAATVTTEGRGSIILDSAVKAAVSVESGPTHTLVQADSTSEFVLPALEVKGAT